MTDAATLQAFPVIDQFGNMNVNAIGGQVLCFQMQDSTGSLVDISSFSYVFRVAGQIDVPLTIGQDLFSQTLTIPDGVFGLPVESLTPWAIVDVTSTPGLTVRSGTLSVYGFAS